MGADQILIFAVLAPFVFVVIRQAVQWAVDSGLPTRLYLRYVYPRRTLEAHLKGDARLAEQQVYRSYLAALTAGADGDREIALQYLAQLPATQELADGLIKALPRQNRRDLQMRMLRLLRYSLAELGKSDHEPQPGFANRLPAWSQAISVWITEAVLIALSWSRLAQLAIGPFIVISLMALTAALLPLTQLVPDKWSIVKLAGLILTVGLGLLWWFSEVTHAGMDSTPRRLMDAYGFSHLEVQIAYPRWLMADDVDSCDDRVAVSVFGSNPLAAPPIEISFQYDHEELFVSNKDCHAISPSFLIGTSNPAGEPAEFFVKPMRRESLARGSIRVTPLVRNPANGEQRLPAVDLAFTIQLEDPIWQTIRDIGKIGGASSVPAFLAIAYGWYRRKQ